MSIFSFTQLKALIESFKDNDSMGIEIIAAFFRKLVREIVTPVRNINYPFVVRSSPNNTGEIFSNISRCSYNPFVESIPLQRCNYRSQQVFYGAIPANMKNIDAGMTALLETSIDYAENINNRSKHFTLSRWVLQRPLKVFVLPFSQQSAKNNNDFEEMNKIFDSLLLQTFPNQETYQYYKGFLEYMSEIFCKGVDKTEKDKYYKISAAFYNELMDMSKSEGKDIDGLIYPSANSKSEGMNIALKKELIDEKQLVCDHTIMFIMLRNPNRSNDIWFPLASSPSEPDSNGNIEFKNIAKLP